MNERVPRLLPSLAILGTTLFGIYTALFHSTYITNTDYLGGLVVLQVLLAAVWKYEQRFFPLMLMVFLWAGMAVPMREVWTSGRWPVLAVGAIAGFALYMHSQGHAFGTFHLLALICVLAAFASASVSSLRTASSLKALGLLLLFLYCSTGARLTLAGREEKFFRHLLLFVETLVYISAASYFVLRFPFYGNPNSMGAIMGVIAVPLLFWRVLVTEGKTGHRRACFVFVVSLGLLFFSQARAGVLAAAVACCLTCVSLRRYRMLVQGTMACMGIALLAITLTPSKQLKNMPSLGEKSSLSSTFLYKGNPESGLLLSRKTQWDEAVSAIGEHPWLGNGYGTTQRRGGDDMEFGTYSSSSSTNRERGDSYLLIMEGVGLLGVLPFLSLVFLLVSKVGGVFTRLRRTSNPRHASVPVAMVLVAGLVHAGFEDWLFRGWLLSLRLFLGAGLCIRGSSSFHHARRLSSNHGFRLQNGSAKRLCGSTPKMIHLILPTQLNHMPITKLRRVAVRINSKGTRIALKSQGHITAPQRTSPTSFHPPPTRPRFFLWCSNR